MVASLLIPAVPSAPPLAPAASATAWSQAATVNMPWDVDHAVVAKDGTTVRVQSDGKFLYVRFDARQHSPVIANQHSDDSVTGGSNINGGIAWSDDAVWVDLWPTGPGGFQYQFESNPIGAHNESSSENVSFAPSWQSRGVVGNDGFTVTMAIPLAVIHGAHAGVWHIQFARYVRSTGELNVWSYEKDQTNPDDAARAGNVTLSLVSRPPLPKPRIVPYALGDYASRTVGGSTSRVGMDFSIPVAQTAAVYGTLHPDYSNVELDQQSISPTVFQRIFSEVRPFFTQGAYYYNNFNCDVCNGFRTTLYTPAIPTPRDGYAFEGKDGNFGLAAFDALGDQRNDSATAMNYTSPDTHWNASAQHVIAAVPGIIDDSNEAGVNWWNGKHLSAYFNYANDSGTLVSNRGDGVWFEGGGGWSDQHFALYGSARKIGSQFNPYDGFDSHPGIAGYALYSARIWTFAPQDFLASAGVDLFMDRYQGVKYGIAQSDNSLLFDFLTKNTIDLQLFSGSNYWRFGSALTPISQSGGFQITYHSGMQNNVNNFPSHGSSATPTQINYSTGRYGAGRLDTWFRSSTLRVGDRGSLTFAVDNTAQWMPLGQHDNVQWFDSVSYSYQVDRNSSLAIGLRRVIGVAPQPNGGGNCLGRCSNVSVAYHLRLVHDELYFAYGDPNTLTTVPQAIFKLIFYAGGEKGT
jgi:hypothetical protein